MVTSAGDRFSATVVQVADAEDIVSSMVSSANVGTSAVSMSANDDAPVMVASVGDSVPDAGTDDGISSIVAGTDEVTFPELQDFKVKHRKQLIFGHLNINSVKNKFHEIQDILNDNLIDIFGLCETKLDDTFSNSEFKVQDYSCHRNDRNIYGGGLMFYVRSSIPHRRRNDCCVMSGTETLVIEITLRKEKMFFVLVYKPPNVSNQYFIETLGNVLDKCLSESKSVYILGDVNINFLELPRCVINFLEAYRLTNLISEATCFKSVSNPSLIDVILTNTPNRIASHLNISIGVSDFHNFVCAATKMHAPKSYRRKIIYRTYKKFDQNAFVNDLDSIPFDICSLFDDVDDVMWAYNILLSDVVNLHAPVKTKVLKKPQLVYMNGELRRAINVKAMLKRKFDKCKNSTNWLLYKQQRNLVTSLKRKSMSQYFNERCNSNTNPKQFWRTVKPFFCNQVNNDHIVLKESDNLVCDPLKVCDTFNDYFINIAKDNSEDDVILGRSVDEVLDYYKDHSSVLNIKSIITGLKHFSFTNVTNDIVVMKVKQLKVNRSCGYDLIPSKLLKIGCVPISDSFTMIINKCINQCIFPEQLKHAEVTPLFKKNDYLDKSNYRPVSILTAMSKVFESIMCEQIMNFFDQVMSPSLSAYRKLYSTNNVIMKCLENWRYALDNKKIVGCVAMDLSRAFDSIPHGLLVAKFNAYGANKNACNLVHSYLSNRKQRVKINSHKSDWSCIVRGVPQGSMMGPILFNIYLNDLLFILEKDCTVYNYADDNNLSFIHEDVDVVKGMLEDVCNQAIMWFNENFMRVNPEKFQFMLLNSSINISLNVSGSTISNTDMIKLLGVYIDKKLDFDYHIGKLLCQGGKQVNVLGRLSRKLNESCKLKILEAFITSNFTYCSLAYNECKLADACKLEKLLKRALRYVYLDFTSSYKDLLLKADRCPLYVRRKRFLLEAVYKILNDKYLPLTSQFYTKSISAHNLRNVNHLVQPMYNSVKYGFKSLRYKGAKYWNVMPDQLKCNDFNQFKLNVKHFIQACQCGYCLLCMV